MSYLDCKVISNAAIVTNYGRIKLAVPTIARASNPGQFIMLKFWQGNEPFFMRPFSINSVDRKAGTIEVLYKIVGVGTAMLQKIKPDTEMKILGPLGNTFPVKDSFKRIAIVGRGVGAAPMRFLMEHAKEKGIECHVFISASKPEYLFDEAFYQSAGVEYIGSCDDSRMITSYFEEKLNTLKFDAAYTCGSNRLIREIKRLSDLHGFEGYASLEEHMACGIGACKGCVCTVYRDRVEEYARVCKEGPIFSVHNLVK